MSRTYRDFGPFYAKNGKHYRDAQERHHPGFHPGNWWSHLAPGYDFRKVHVVHGRDGAMPMDIGYPSAKTPNCYNGWNEVWGMYRKRHAKFGAGRYRRLRDQRIIREALAEFGEGDHEQA